MRFVRLLAMAALGGAGLASTPAWAEVTNQSDAGFEIELGADTPATASDAWQELIAPARWWSSEHTYSGDAANLYIDPQASGCFCEKLPVPKDAPAGQRIGSVEHMHVIYADPVRRVLRMKGALGPLQSEALDGTLTITLKPVGEGTRIEWNYVVGGFMRMKSAEIAPLVDKVLSEQLARLAARLSPEAGAVPAKP